MSTGTRLTSAGQVVAMVAGPPIPPRRRVA